MTEKLVFIHIPKNAGTSARLYLERRFGKKAAGWMLLDFSPDELKDAKPGGKLDKLKLIGGHFEFDLARNIPGPKVYAAQFRDPVVRAISLFRYIQRKPDHRLHSQLSEDLVESCQRIPGLLQGIANVQVRYLGGRKRKSEVEDAMAVLCSNPFYLTNARNSHGLIDAIESDFKHLMPHKARYKVANVNKKGSTSDPLLDDARTREFLEEITQKDRRLYNILQDKLGEEGVVTPSRPLTL